MRSRRPRAKSRRRNLKVAGQTPGSASSLHEKAKATPLGRPAKPPPQCARPRRPLLPSGHAAAPPPLPTSCPRRGGDERRPAGRGGEPGGERGPAAWVQPRAPRGAAGARGAGRRARCWGLGHRTPRLPVSWLNVLSTRVRRRERPAHFVAGSAASGRPSRSGKPREGRYGTLTVAATFCCAISSRDRNGGWGWGKGAWVLSQPVTMCISLD